MLWMKSSNDNELNLQNLYTGEELHLSSFQRPEDLHTELILQRNKHGTLLSFILAASC